MGTETEVREAISLSAAVSGIDRNREKLAEMHTRITRQDEQLDRIETALSRQVALWEAREKRECQATQARSDMIGKLLAVLKNPALLAAVGAGGLSLGGNQLCNSARSHQTVAPAVMSAPAGAPDTGQ